MLQAIKSRGERLLGRVRLLGEIRYLELVVFSDTQGPGHKKKFYTLSNTKRQKT